ncbi:MAG TPA: CotH kinase family protein [Ilumatobacteraceae bacterium]|nr:CotH kinase family protein [Ilumatobacteraceae bacterium]
MTISPHPSRPSRRFRSALTAATAGLVLLTGCAVASEATPPDAAAADGAGANAASVAVADGDGFGDDAVSVEVDLFDSSVVHTISVDFDQSDYDAMIETFTTTGDKEWIAATVTIDGVTYEDVGLRLKGNSSLFGLTSATSGSPEDLPWLIRLDKFVDGEDHQGYEDIVIRSNSTETALNEAVAQELLAVTGLASQSPIATAFTVNGGETELRLAVENPDEEWYKDNFDDKDGLLYKADSDGDYSYRGDDVEAYIDVFDQEVGDDDMQPLIDFLDFINNADDATFAAELGDRLDVDAFATYLAFQDLIGNADDINGRGNNSYLQYDTATDQFTVVSWDLNLAFDTANVGGGGGVTGGGVPGGGRPAGGGAGRPAGPIDGGAAGGVGGPGDQANVLVDRFMADEGFAALYAAKTDELTAALFSSGTVDEVIANWVDVLINGASDLVSEATVTAEAAALIDYVDGVR